MPPIERGVRGEDAEAAEKAAGTTCSPTVREGFRMAKRRSGGPETSRANTQPDRVGGGGREGFQDGAESNAEFAEKTRMPRRAYSNTYD